MSEPKKRKVLLYSGGMDSYMASYLEEPDACVYVDVGSVYGAKEMARLASPAHGVLVKERLDLGRFERDDLILPQRNAFMVLLAAMHGEHVVLAATSGDRSCDKDRGFALQMKRLMDHMWQEQHWTGARTFDVLLPFATVSKAQLVGQFLMAGGDEGELMKLAGSCYDARSSACGKCKACARRWVALKKNGLYCDDVFDNNPRAYFTEEVMQRAREGKYRGTSEDADIVAVVESY